MWSLTSKLLALVLAVSRPTELETRLDVKTSVGTFRGTLNASSGLESWLGIPYAKPPLGKLRFKAPSPIETPFKSVRYADQFGSACPQPVSEYTKGVSIGEDCLVLNIFRPANTTTNDKLPVLIWIHGGGYNFGTSSDPAYNPTFLINRSVVIGKPIIFVSINYRINTFGFLASSHVDPKDLNAGLQDQDFAFAFVQREIGAFGGDPEKVTIWGQSAGAGSVEAHVLFPTNKSLFRAAILDSSTGPFKSAPFPEQYDKPGTPYSRLVELLGCSATFSFTCLQQAPFETLINASNLLIGKTLNLQLWHPTVGPSGNLVSVRPSQKMASGDFLRVPMLWGTNLNEGTVFSASVAGLPKMSLVEENSRFDEFIGALILDKYTLSADVLDRIHSLYPANDSFLGGVFNTGDSLFDRAEAWYSDNMYLAPRRLFFNRAANLQPLFAYYFIELLPGDDPMNGVFHGSELRLIFGDTPTSEPGFAAKFTDSYINFVTELNPGSFWPQYDLKRKSVLQWKKDNITVIPDDFQLHRTDFLNSARVLGEFEKR